jgi:DNA polymerase II large subunit
MHWTTGKEQPERISINGKLKLLSDIQAIQKKPRQQLHHQAHQQRFSCSSIGKHQQLQKTKPKSSRKDKQFLEHEIKRSIYSGNVKTCFSKSVQQKQKQPKFAFLLTDTLLNPIIVEMHLLFQVPSNKNKCNPNLLLYSPIQ